MTSKDKTKRWKNNPESRKWRRKEVCSRNENISNHSQFPRKLFRILCQHTETYPDLLEWSDVACHWQLHVLKGDEEGRSEARRRSWGKRRSEVEGRSESEGRSLMRAGERSEDGWGEDWSNIGWDEGNGNWSLISRFSRPLAEIKNEY